jgi:hypothetical protein
LKEVKLKIGKEISLMEQQNEEKEPLLKPIKNGWAAFGDGWAVHGHTREEAIQKFREAERRYREIDARPLWYERTDKPVTSEESYA